MLAFRLLVVTLLFVVPLFTNYVSCYSTNDIKVWCNQTPNLEPCEYLLNNNPTHQLKSLKTKDDFLKLSLQVAQERALIGHSHTLSLGPKCRNARDKAVWCDKKQVKI